MTDARTSAGQSSPDGMATVRAGNDGNDSGTGDDLARRQIVALAASPMLHVDDFSGAEGCHQAIMNLIFMAGLLPLEQAAQSIVQSLDDQGTHDVMTALYNHATLIGATAFNELRESEKRGYEERAESLRIIARFINNAINKA